MSKKTEDALRAFHEFMDKNMDDDMTEDDLNRLSKQFINEYNGQIRMNVTEKSAKTSADYLELAENTTGKTKKLQYVKKALELDPDNFDAEIMLVDLTSKTLNEELAKYEEAVERAPDVMKKKGLMTKDDIGDYWLLIETRPYMRLRYEYIRLLIGCGKFRKAADECKELLRLCKTDNLGVRYTLMHIYAHLEMENEALRLFKKFDGSDETQMLLPMAILYYKVGKLDIAKKYLTELVTLNKDTKKFIKDLITSAKDNDPFDDIGFGYAPNSYEELSFDLQENSFLFVLCTPFLEWADEQLKRKRKSNKDTGNE